MQLKLQVVLIPVGYTDISAAGMAARKFLHLASPTSSLSDVCDALLTRYYKLYPDAEMLDLEGIQDKDCCDLDPDFAAGDVFSSGDILRVLVRNSFHSLSRDTSTVLPAGILDVSNASVKRGATVDLDADFSRVSKRSRTIWAARQASANTSSISAVSATPVSANSRPKSPSNRVASSPVHLPPPAPLHGDSPAKITPHKRNSPASASKGHRITSGMLVAPPSAEKSRRTIFSDNDDTDIEVHGSFSQVARPSGGAVSVQTRDNIVNNSDSDQDSDADATVITSNTIVHAPAAESSPSPQPSPQVQAPAPISNGNGNVSLPPPEVVSGITPSKNVTSVHLATSTPESQRPKARLTSLKRTSLWPQVQQDVMVSTTDKKSSPPMIEKSTPVQSKKPAGALVPAPVPSKPVVPELQSQNPVPVKPSANANAQASSSGVKFLFVGDEAPGPVTATPAYDAYLAYKAAQAKETVGAPNAEEAENSKAQSADEVQRAYAIKEAFLKNKRDEEALRVSRAKTAEEAQALKAKQAEIEKAKEAKAQAEKEAQAQSQREQALKAKQAEIEAQSQREQALKVKQAEVERAMQAEMERIKMAQIEAQTQREAQAKREAQAQAQREAQAQAQREAQAKAQREAQAKAQREAQAQAQREAQAQAQREQALKAKQAEVEAEKKRQTEALKAKQAEMEAEKKRQAEALKAKQAEMETEKRQAEALKAKQAEMEAEKKRQAEALKAREAEEKAQALRAQQEEKEAQALRAKQAKERAQQAEKADALRALKAEREAQAFKAKKAAEQAHTQKESQVPRTQEENATLFVDQEPSSNPGVFEIDSDEGSAPAVVTSKTAENPAKISASTKPVGEATSSNAKAPAGAAANKQSNAAKSNSMDQNSEGPTLPRNEFIKAFKFKSNLSITPKVREMLGLPSADSSLDSNDEERWKTNRLVEEELRNRQNAAKAGANVGDRRTRSRATVNSVPDLETIRANSALEKKEKERESKAKQLPSPFSGFASKAKLSSDLIKLQKLDARIDKRDAERIAMSQAVKLEDVPSELGLSQSSNSQTGTTGPKVVSSDAGSPPVPNDDGDVDMDEESGSEDDSEGDSGEESASGSGEESESGSEDESESGSSEESESEEEGPKTSSTNPEITLSSQSVPNSQTKASQSNVKENPLVEVDQDSSESEESESEESEIEESESEESESEESGDEIDNGNSLKASSEPQNAEVQEASKNEKVSKVQGDAESQVASTGENEESSGESDFSEDSSSESVSGNGSVIVSENASKSSQGAPASTQNGPSSAAKDGAARVVKNKVNERPKPKEVISIDSTSESESDSDSESESEDSSEDEEPNVPKNASTSEVKANTPAPKNAANNVPSKSSQAVPASAAGTQNAEESRQKVQPSNGKKVVSESLVPKTTPAKRTSDSPVTNASKKLKSDLLARLVAKTNNDQNPPKAPSTIAPTPEKPKNKIVNQGAKKQGELLSQNDSAKKPQATGKVSGSQTPVSATPMASKKVSPPAVSKNSQKPGDITADSPKSRELNTSMRVNTETTTNQKNEKRENGKAGAKMEVISSDSSSDSNSDSISDSSSESDSDEPIDFSEESQEKAPLASSQPVSKTPVSRLLPKNYKPTISKVSPQPAAPSQVKQSDSQPKPATQKPTQANVAKPAAPAPANRKKINPPIKKPMLSSLADLSQRGVPQVMDKQVAVERKPAKPAISLFEISSSDSSSDSDSDSSDSSDEEDDGASKFMSVKNIEKAKQGMNKKKNDGGGGFSSLMKDAKKK